MYDYITTVNVDYLGIGVTWQNGFEKVVMVQT